MHIKNRVRLTSGAMTSATTSTAPYFLRAECESVAPTKTITVTEPYYLCVLSTPGMCRLTRVLTEPYYLCVKTRVCAIYKMVGAARTVFFVCIRDAGCVSGVHP